MPFFSKWQILNATPRLDRAISRILSYAASLNEILIPAQTQEPQNQRTVEWFGLEGSLKLITFP